MQPLTSYPDIDALVTGEAVPCVQENFGSYPFLQVPLAEAGGFRNDKELDLLVADAVVWEAGRLTSRASRTPGFATVQGLSTIL